MSVQKKVAIYNPYLETRGGGEKVCLAIAEHLSKNYDVTLISRKKIDLQDLGKYFSLDLSKCSHTLLTSKSKLSKRIRLPSRITNLMYEHEDYKRIKKSKYDIFINACYKSNMPSPAKKGLYVCMFPQEFVQRKKLGVLKRTYHIFVNLIEKMLYGKTGIDILDTYQVITVNSGYTRSWVEKLWGLKPEDIDILYPICEDMGPPAKKQKIILNVGRFFANIGDSHYKCQDKLLDTFKSMPKLIKDGWELHFLGSVAEDVESLKYVLDLVKDSSGFPVYFHFNAPFVEVKKLFRDSAIYWHATGWGSNPDLKPEKQEHFGISTVEAMSAGAVPIVINTAGQKEIVSNEQDGLLWNNKSELVKSTLKVVNNKQLMDKLALGAINTSEKYARPNFEKKLDNLMAKLNS